jgi:Family of unknown function (DUF5318)
VSGPGKREPTGSIEAVSNGRAGTLGNGVSKRPGASNGNGASNGHAASNGHGGMNGHGGSGGRGRRLFGSVDYTLAKRALLREFHGGLLSRLEICDAHPELMRAAKYVGEPTTRPCPVCSSEGLRLLAYVYADDLKSDNGRVWELREALAVTASHRGGSCYVVEVCTRCSWNHLYRSFRARSAG